MGNGRDHNILVNQVLIELGKYPELVRAWRNETGAARMMNNPERIIHYGLKGSADITGILNNGKRLEMEVKTGNATQSKQQKLFNKMIDEFNGIYCVVKSTNEAIELIKKNASI